MDLEPSTKHLVFLTTEGSVSAGYLSVVPKALQRALAQHIFEMQKPGSWSTLCIEPMSFLVAPT